MKTKTPQQKLQDLLTKRLEALQRADELARAIRPYRRNSTALSRAYSAYIEARTRED